MAINRSPGTTDGRSSADFLTGIWAAVPTPFSEAGELDIAGIEQNARRFRHDVGLHGIFCNGLMGEQWSLTLEERKLILEASLAGAEGAMHVGVVVSAASLTDTLMLVEHASRTGAHHVVLMSPPGFVHTQEIERYIQTVARASGVPVILFDGGAQTGGFPAELIARLADDGYIHGVKCARGAEAAEVLREVCTTPISIVDPYESQGLNNLLRFEHQVLYADPEPYLFQFSQRRVIAEYFAAYAAGDLEGAARLFRELEPIRRLYHRWIMGPLKKGYPINAVLKRWFEYMGFAAGPVREPLVPLSPEDKSRFDSELNMAFRQVYGEDFSFPIMGT